MTTRWSAAGCTGFWSTGRVTTGTTAPARANPTARRVSVVLQHPQLDGLFTGHLSPTHHELLLNLSFFTGVDATRSPQMKG
jgi:hypothetical protein